MSCIYDLRHRILLLKRHIIEQNDGSFIEKWQENTTRWAHIVPCLTQETSAAEWNSLKHTPAKYKIVMRFYPESFSRIQWNTTLLGLLGSPFMDPHRQWTTCMTYIIGEKDE